MSKALDFQLLTLVMHQLKERGQKNVYFVQYAGMVMPCHILSIQNISQDPYGMMNRGVSAILTLEITYMTQDSGMQVLLEQAHSLTQWFDGHTFLLKDHLYAIFKRMHYSIDRSTEDGIKVMRQKYDVLIRGGNDATKS